MIGDCIEKIENITFDRMNEQGPYGVSSDNLIVFLDNDSTIRPRYRETWKCKLKENPNPMKKNYFATPVELIQEISISELKEEPERTEIADTDKMIFVGNDTIYWRSFSGRYDVYRSLNGSSLQMIHYENGDIQTEGSSIELSGLSDIIQKEAPCDLEYTVKENSILIKLQ